MRWVRDSLGIERRSLHRQDTEPGYVSKNVLLLISDFTVFGACSSAASLGYWDRTWSLSVNCYELPLAKCQMTQATSISQSL